MADNRKIFILVPDGVGLRNFAYGNFPETAARKGWDLTFWNDTPFDLNSIGLPNIGLKGTRIHPLTYVLKNVRLRNEIARNIRRTGDNVYHSYSRPFSYKGVKLWFRGLATDFLISLTNSDAGLRRVRKSIHLIERGTQSYRNALEKLKSERPAVVFCTNQRTAQSIAPILAAHDLGIPTATFIFSWDNLPKATLVVEPDYYMVWSEHMRDELLFYYDWVRPDQIVVTGTPQFEPHFNKALIMAREEFCARYGLEPARRYICFSGDDVTTSPDDPQYLADTAAAIRKLNDEGRNFGLIFRRCPVDFSGRYDAVLTQYADVITPISPVWKAIGGAWNGVLPTAADVTLLMNTIAHTEMVVNLGSSMVFDYACFGKPCAFIRYEAENKQRPDWSINKIYRFVHFRSMPSPDAVAWIDGPEMLADVILNTLADPAQHVAAAKEWFAVIDRQPADQASARIIDAFGSILENVEKKA